MEFEEFAAKCKLRDGTHTPPWCKFSSKGWAESACSEDQCPKLQLITACKKLLKRGKLCEHCQKPMNTPGYDLDVEWAPKEIVKFRVCSHECGEALGKELAKDPRNNVLGTVAHGLKIGPPARLEVG